MHSEIGLASTLRSLAWRSTFQSGSFRRWESQFNGVEDYTSMYVGNNPEFYLPLRQVLRKAVVSHGQHTVSLLSVGCGDGFELGVALESGKNINFVGVDSSERQVSTLFSRYFLHPRTNIFTECASAEVLHDAEFQNRVIEFLGGPSDICCADAVLHILRKSGIALEPILLGVKSCLNPSGTLVVGNYFHDSIEEYEEYRANWLNVSGQTATPPDFLLTDRQMATLLEATGFSVESLTMNPRSKLGIRSYILTATLK